MLKLGDYELLVGNKKVLPIIVGGMGVDISTSELALEACRLGGVGHISDAMSPYLSDKFFKTRYQAEKKRNFLETRKDPASYHAKWF